ncbi:MAG: glycosyltransferase [Pirellulaceae bacterium]|nr:glycosyltransferase [Pirellulaceae bacterium]
MNAVLQTSLPVVGQQPLNIGFVITSMPMGGAETLLVNLLRSFDSSRIRPQVICLKDKGVLGEEIAGEFPIHSQLIHNRWDAGVLLRLRTLLHREQMSGVVTVGAGDKMFWGRLAARSLKLPVIISALHSTGWPDGVGRANRLLTPITDAFVAVAHAHGQFLVEFEHFPAEKVHVVPNGIDTNRFRFSATARAEQRAAWGWNETTAVCGVVAALRPEKNLKLFLQSAALVLRDLSDSGFVIVGSGPEESGLRETAEELGIADRVRFLGMRKDTPEILSGLDLFALTSDNEASPVSILEALGVERPVVATKVGSIPETVLENQTGFLVPAGLPEPMAAAWLKVLADRELGERLGKNGRQRVVKHHSLQSMTDGYMDLIESIHNAKTQRKNFQANMSRPRR